MPRRPKTLVFDSWSVMAYFEGEPAGEQVAILIGDAHENETGLIMSVVNAAEVWYILAREVSQREANKTISEMRQLGIEFVDADWRLAEIAAQFKARCKMSFADCFATALAKENKAELVTGDQEFKQVESDIKIRWV